MLNSTYFYFLLQTCMPTCSQICVMQYIHCRLCNWPTKVKVILQYVYNTVYVYLAEGGEGISGMPVAGGRGGECGRTPRPPSWHPGNVSSAFPGRCGLQCPASRPVLHSGRPHIAGETQDTGAAFLLTPPPQ
jgi:hypothetical protein